MNWGGNMGKMGRYVNALRKACLAIAAILGISLLFVVPQMIETEKQKIHQGLSFQNAVLNYQQLVTFSSSLLEGSLDMEVLIEETENGSLYEICKATITETVKASISGFSSELNGLIHTTSWTLMEYGQAVANGDTIEMTQLEEELRELCALGQHVLEALTQSTILYVEWEPASFERAYFYGENLRQMFRNKEAGRPLEHDVTPSFWDIKNKVDKVISET